MIRIALLVALALCFLNVQAQQKQQRPPEKTRLLFLLDASGSMLDNWGRNQTKLNAAKSILSKIVDSLRQNNRIELALRLYGHKSPPGVNNCKDTDLEVPFKINNHQQIIDRINQIKPKGVTPISYALEQSANDFPAQSGYRNIVILITDGIESCGGDPCAVSQALQRKGVFLQPYIIGLGMKAERSLDCAGIFLNAETPGRFYDILNEAIERSFARTTVSVSLVGANRKPETNINVTFRNSFTGATAYELVNYLDRNNRPDSVEVDPLVDYDLVVSTLPKVTMPRVAIKQGEHTTVSIPVVQGDLVISQESRVNDPVQALIREKGKSETLHVQTLNERVRYLAGEYEVEVLTLPRRTFLVAIPADKTFTLHLPAPGNVNVNTIGPGYGSLYEVMTDGSHNWVKSLDNLKSVFTLSLQPGQYKIVFRVRHSQGSKYTAFKMFTVKSGRTTQVSVFE
jgi:Ca-activated chloride channel homolog